MKSMVLAAIAAVVVSASPAAAVTNLVTNGNFSSTTTTSISGNFQLTAGGTYGTVTGWTTSGSGYNLLFNASNATTAAGNAYGTFSSNGSTTAKEYLNSLPAGTTGKFLALDGETSFATAVTQSITGLVNGQRYSLDFDWAASSLASRQGALTDGLTATINGQTFTTAQASIPSGWAHASYSFVYNSGAGNLLSFLSVGTPSGLPPVGLLANVSLTAVPEPATWGMMIVGFGMIGATVRYRRRNTQAAIV